MVLLNSIKLKTRIDIADKTDSFSIRCNCYGTALFIAGINNTDGYTEPEDVRKKLLKAGFSETKKKTQGDIVLICEAGGEQLLHAGVITGMESLNIAHRISFGWPGVATERLAAITYYYAREPILHYFKKRLNFR